MKASIRLVTLAFTAVALASPLSAQGRSGQRGGGHSSAPRGYSAPRGQAAPRGYSAPRGQAAAPRGYAAPRGGQMASRGPQRAPQDYHGQQYAPTRPENRGYRAPQDFNGRNGYRVPVADHGRPLVTRGGVRGGEYGRSSFGGDRDFRGDRGFRGGNEFRGRREFRGGRWYFGGRAFPFGWESRVVFGGYFPVAYAGYCDAVPYDYDYLLPPMMPSYDPCYFGDRIVVFDRFSRSIVFVATL
jgi:hypothetical protein